MEAVAGDEAGYGYHKLTHLLRQNYRLEINKKKVYRLCKELEILKQQRKVRKVHPRRLAINRTITAPNQLRETDLKYGYVAGEDRLFFILSFIDVFNREIKRYHTGLACETKHVVQALKQEELAFRCELDRSFISLLERGKSSPTLKSIVLSRYIWV